MQLMVINSCLRFELSCYLNDPPVVGEKQDLRTDRQLSEDVEAKIAAAIRKVSAIHATCKDGFCVFNVIFLPYDKSQPYFSSMDRRQGLCGVRILKPQKFGPRISGPQPFIDQRQYPVFFLRKFISFVALAEQQASVPVVPVVAGVIKADL